jgi:ubiquinone/menaquinone biosynthesis C-methylase UbiE
MVKTKDWFKNIESFYDELAPYYDRIVDPQTIGIRDSKLVANIYKQINVGNDVPKILELGCGTGETVKNFLNLGIKKVYAYDISSNMLSLCRSKCGNSVELQKGNFLNVSESYPPQFFDIIVMVGGGLMHLPDEGALSETLKNINKVLKTGGLFLFDLDYYTEEIFGVLDKSNLIHVEKFYLKDKKKMVALDIWERAESCVNSNVFIFEEIQDSSISRILKLNFTPLDERSVDSKLARLSFSHLSTFEIGDNDSISNQMFSNDSIIVERKTRYKLMKKEYNIG